MTSRTAITGNRLALAAAVIFVLLIGVAAATWYRHHWIDRLGAFDIQDAGRLPDRVHACGRDWHRDPSAAPQAISFWRARWGIEPVVIDIAPFAPCPEGPCTNVAGDACETVVLVRVADDGYVAFELVGGP